MAEESLSLHLDVPGGHVSAGFEGDGTCYARTTAPFRTAVDHVGFYRAELAPERVTSLRRRFRALESPPTSEDTAPDEPEVTFTTTAASGEMTMRSVALREIGPTQRAALDEACLLLEELFAHPVTALLATGSLPTRMMPASGPLRFSARFQNIGAETVRWLHVPSALGSGQGRAGIEIIEVAPGVEADAQRAANADLSARVLRLSKLDGSPVAASPEISTPPGDALVLSGESAFRLEPGRYRATLHVQLGEPADADGSCTFGLWNIDLGDFEVQP